MPWQQARFSPVSSYDTVYSTQDPYNITETKTLCASGNGESNSPNVPVYMQFASIKHFF